MRALCIAGIACMFLIQTHVHGAGPSVLQSASCVGSSPRAVVQAYYAAINHHQAANAQACLTPYFKAEAHTFVDPDWTNIEYVHRLSLRSHTSRPVPRGMLPGNVPRKYANPYAAAEVTAQFTVRYYHIVDSPNGLTIRFIYAVKQHTYSPWRIAAIGSGP